MINIGLLSDTHSYLDERVFEFFKDCDQVWHAGDFGTVDVSDKLADFKPLRGVYGNIDGQTIRIIHPLYQLFLCEQVKVLMIHIGGSPGNYYPDARKLIERHRPQLFICGHSHICRVQHDKRFNTLYMNPGAAGQYGPHHVRTIMRFSINGSAIEKAEVIELGKRINQ